MEYPIQQLAKAAGTTSRTLRHYDSLGLVVPSRIGSNGYRYYDDRSLVRLQRVLLLREMGLGLDAIGTVLVAQEAGAQAHDRPSVTESRVLAQHLEMLSKEKQRIEAQIASVERTIAALQRDGGVAHEANAGHATQKGESLMAQNIFNGFDHTAHKREVEERWGAMAYAKSDRWWRGLDTAGQQDWQQLVVELSNDWAAAAAVGEDPHSPIAQDLAQRHVEWLCSVPGTPAWNSARRASESEAADLEQSSAQFSAVTAAAAEQLREYLLGLGEMYVADDRFAANYGGKQGATFVRDALQHYVVTHLG